MLLNPLTCRESYQAAVAHNQLLNSLWDTAKGLGNQSVFSERLYSYIFVNAILSLGLANKNIFGLNSDVMVLGQACSCNDNNS